MGPLQDGEGHPVAVHDRIQDHDVDGLLVDEAHQVQILGVDALHPARHVAAEGLEGQPGRVRSLGAGCRLDQGGQQEKTGEEGAWVHPSSLP